MLNDEIANPNNELMNGRVGSVCGGEQPQVALLRSMKEPLAGALVPTGPVRPMKAKDASAIIAASKDAPRDSFARDIAQYRYENRKTLFAHLAPKDWPRQVRMNRSSPERVFFRSASGRLLKINPFRSAEQRKERASMLRSEVPRLYSAMAFAMWRYGRVMNAHLTVCWKLLGVTDHNKAARLLSLYNHEAAKWLSVGDGDDVVRSRRSRRASVTSAPHLFVYVHEHAQEKGFHSHELMCVPLGRAQEFAQWSRKCLVRLSECARPDEAAVFFSPASQKRRRFRPYAGARESFAVDRQWRWFRYLTKSLDPHHQEHSPADGAWHVAREVFQITRPFMATGPVTCRKLAGFSENIGPGAQTRAGFVSKFEAGDWAGLYSGSELDDHRAYVAALAEEQHAQDDAAQVRAILENITI